ncbi:MAG: helix-turn-helix domain-containing protein [Treponemataceae bacterium]
MENVLNDPAIPWKGISELIEQAGSSRNKRDFLKRLLEGLETLIPCDTGSGLLRSDGQYIACCGFDLKTVQDYNTYYVNKWDFLPLPLNQAIIGGSRYDLLPVNWTLYPNTEFVADFCRPLHIDSSLTFFQPGSAISITLHRKEKTILFNDTEKTTLRILNAHMNNYLRLYEKLDDAAPQIPAPSEIRSRFPKLSARENEVVHQSCIGFSAALIAKRSGVSRRTVESQLLSAYQKLDVDTKKEMIGKVVDFSSGKSENGASADSEIYIL